jgi:membrane protease YdiL (CAAX protease family)
VTKKRDLITFFAIAYIWAWLVFVPLTIKRGPLQWTVLATFAPTVAAFVTHRIGTGNYKAIRFLSSGVQVAGATILGVLLILVAYVVLPAVAVADSTKLNWSILASVSVYNSSTFLGGPIGEEPGWRGYALPRLEAAFGAIPGTLILAVLWALWHLPLFFYPNWTSSPLWIFILIQTGASIIFSYGTNISQFSVIPAIAMHAMFNTVSKFLNGMFIHTQPTISISFELVMALCGLSVAAVLILATKGRLAFRKNSPGPQ